MTVDFNTALTNPYRLLSDLGNAFRPQKTDGGYIRVSAKGTFELHDYNCGIYFVEVKTIGYNQNNDSVTKEGDTISYCVLFSIGCMDDGLWQAWSKYMPLEKCNVLVERIKTEFLDDLVTIPTAKEVNEGLEPFGLYGEFTG